MFELREAVKLQSYPQLSERDLQQPEKAGLTPKCCSVLCLSPVKSATEACPPDAKPINRAKACRSAADLLHLTWRGFVPWLQEIQPLI